MDGLPTGYERYEPEVHDRLILNSTDLGAGGRPNLIAITPEDWRRFVARPGGLDGRHFIVERSGIDVKAIIMPFLKHSPVYRRSAYLSTLGSPGIDGMRFVMDELSTDLKVAFYQILRSETDSLVKDTLLPLGFIECEREFSLASRVHPMKKRLDGLGLAESGRIRPATGRDCDAIAVLRTSAFFVDIAFSDLDGTFYRRAIADGEAVLVAEVDGNLGGYVHCVREADVFWVENIVVTPAHRRGGIARSLLKGALDQFATCDFCKLNTSSRNRAAQALYDSLGFAKEAERVRFIAPGALTTSADGGRDG